MIRVLVVDDHPIVRRGMRQILGETHDMKVVGEAGNGAQALSLIRIIRCDVVLLDISLPAMNGLELLTRIKAERPTLPILMLSLHREEQYALRALRAGASGYLVKERTPEELISAIRQVYAGRRYVSAGLAEQLVRSLRHPVPKTAHEALSDREFQILHLLARGKRLKEIGQELALNPKTVSTYRARVLDKMHLQTNADITRYAIEHQLSDSPLLLEHPSKQTPRRRRT
jgi:DNA-binding NarL/FixJ family response regulator